MQNNLIAGRNDYFKIFVEVFLPAANILKFSKIVLFIIFLRFVFIIIIIIIILLLFIHLFVEQSSL